MGRGFKIADAFVEIHADTTKVKASVEDGIRKSIDKVEVGNASKKLGERIGKNAVGAVASTLSKDLGKAMASAASKTSLTNVGTQAGKQMGASAAVASSKTFVAETKKQSSKNAPSVIGVFKKIGVASAEAFSNEMKRLTDLGPILSGTLMVMIPAAVGAALALVPSLFTIAGAAGMTALAVAVLKDRPKVKNAFGDMVKEVGTTFRGIALPFEEVLVKVAKSTRDIFRDISPDLREIFAGLAPIMSDLVDSFRPLVMNMLPGFKKMMLESGPIINSFGRGLEMLGMAMGDFFDSMADAADDGGRAFEGFMAALSGIIVILGDMIEVASKVAAVWVDVIDASEGFLRLAPIFDAYARSVEGAGGATGKWAEVTRDASGKIISMSDNTDDAAFSAKEFAAQVDAATEAIYKFADAEGVLSTKNIDVIKANYQFQQSLERLGKSIQDNGKSFAQNNIKGAENAAMLAKVAEAAAQVRFKVHQQTGSQELANKAYADAITAAKARMVSLGMEKGFVDRLFSSIMTVGKAKANPEVKPKGPKEGTKAVQDLQAKIKSLQGKIVEARANGNWRAVQALQAEINRLRGRTVNVNVVTTYWTRGTRSSGTGYGVGGIKAGGLMQAKGYAGGGVGRYVRGPGTSTGDKIPALLSDTEFVNRAKVVNQPGVLESLMHLNRYGAWPTNGPTDRRQAPGASTTTVSSRGGGSDGPMVLYATLMLDGKVLDAVMGATLSKNPRAVAAATDEGRRQRSFVSSPRARA